MPLNRTIIVSTHPCSASMRLLFTVYTHTKIISNNRAKFELCVVSIVFDVVVVLLFTMVLLVVVAMVERGK